VDRNVKIVLCKQTPEKTEGTNKNWLSRETGNIGNTRHKTRRTKNTAQYVLDTTMRKQTYIT